MLLFISTHKLLSGLVAFFLFGSIAVQVLVGIRLQKLLDELDKPAGAKSPFLKKCRVHPGQINLNEHVEKCLDTYRIGPFGIRGLKQLSLQGLMLSVIFCGVGVCVGIVRGETIGSLLPFYIFSMIGLYCYYAISGVVDIQTKLDRLRGKLVRYLDRGGHAAPKKGQADKEEEEDAEVVKETAVDKQQDGDSQWDELVELFDELSFFS